MGEFSGNMPVYLQVVDLFYANIISGELKPGAQIPPVRKLAIDWGVNPNTIQKALQVLEQEEITIAHVGRGRFVTEDTKKLSEIKLKLLASEIQKFYLKMQQFGLTDEEILTSFENYLAEVANKERKE